MINTVAGSYPAPGNNGAAAAAFLRFPQFVRTDSAGNVYFTEAYGYAVRKVTPGGTISTLAGTGLSGSPQYGQPATSTPIRWAQGLALDTNGTLYFGSDAMILRVAGNGVLTPAAGTTNGYSGDNGPALQAQLSTNLMGIAIDRAGNLYVADTANNRIRKIDTNGTTSTAAGNGLIGFAGDGGPAAAAELNGPTDVAVDPNGNLYIADRGNHRIRVVSPTGIITTYAGNGTNGFGGDGGSAANAQFGILTGLALDNAGNLYVTDANRIRRITTSSTGPVINTIAGGALGFSGDGGPAAAALFNTPAGLAVDAGGNLYVADSGNHRIRKMTPDGVINTVAGAGHFAGDGGPARAALLGFPSAVAAGAAGVYIADTDNNRVRLVAPDGSIQTVAGTGTAGFSGDGGLATAAQLSGPQGVALDSIGTLYISDTGNNRIRMVAHDGGISTLVGGGSGKLGDGGPAASATLSAPAGITVGPSGNILIADRGNSRVRLVDVQGNINTVAGNGSVGFAGDGGAAASATLNNPLSAAEDSSGNIYIADHVNQRIRKVDTSGTISTFAGNGTAGAAGDGGPAASANLGRVSSVAVDSNGNVWIADPQSGTIRVVDSKGIISTVAGSGEAGFAGDGVFARNARLGAPPALTPTLLGLTVARNGTAYVADWANQIVRSVTPNVSAALTIVSGNNQVGAVNSALPTPLTVSVAGPTGTPVAGATVIFTVTLGSAGISAANCVTAANGQCGVNVELGANPGTVLIGASVTGLVPVVFTLTATPFATPPPAISSVVNGASFQSGIAPNSWITILGSNLFAGQTDTWANSIVNGSLPTKLDGVSVSIGGQPAYVEYVSGAQVNALAPNITSGNTTVTITNSVGTSSAVTVAVQAFQPAFFPWPGGYVVATRQDFSYAIKNGILSGASTTPAKPGDVIILWGTGFGPTQPAAPVGTATPISPTFGAANAVTVTVGGVAATVYGAALAPGFAGLYQVAIQIPTSLADGDYPVIATVNGVQSLSTAMITVQR